MILEEIGDNYGKNSKTGNLHEGESETYYILTGTGIYNDNGTKYPVKAGDVVFCDDGEGHGLLNNGKEDLKFIALILKK